MEKLVQCLHWKEYQGLNGWVMFCSAGAFAKQLSKEEAKQCGCTIAQRATCKKLWRATWATGWFPISLKEKKLLRKSKKLLLNCNLI